MIEYDKLVSKAMRDIIRQVLAHIAANRCEPYIRIRFPLKGSGVIYPPALKPVFNKWKDESDQVTVAIEGIFWDLVVAPEAFSVTLTYQDRKAHRITVPFNAITGFHDMEANFCFQLEPEGLGDQDMSNIVEFKKPA